MSRLKNAATHRVWGTPLVLALITLTSLIGALITEGAWDWLATLSLVGVLTYAFEKGWRSGCE